MMTKSCNDAWQNISPDELPSSQEVWEKIRQALFAKAQSSGSSNSPSTLLNAYIRAITADAARGDKSARKLQIDLLDHLDKAERQVAETESQYKNHPTWQCIQESMRKHDRYRTITQACFTAVYAATIGEIRKNFSDVYGELAGWETLIPHYIDIELHRKNHDAAVRRLHRRQAKGRPYEVGRGKPPVRTRFTAGQSGNPAGPQKQADVLQALRESLLGEVNASTKSGVPTKYTKIGFSITRAIIEAINGDRKARLFIKDIIKHLSRRSLLTPPPPKTRLRRDKNCRSEARRTLAIIAPALIRDLVKLFTAKYGEVPKFTTSYEKEVASWLSEIEPSNENLPQSADNSSQNISL